MACCCLSATVAAPTGAVSPLLLPLAGKVSAYKGARYFCTVTAATITAAAVTLTISVRGDGSKGPLQSPSDSVLSLGGLGEWPPVVHPAPGNTDTAWDGTLTFSRLGWCGLPLKRGSTVYFRYGDVGYSTVELLTVDYDV